MVGTLMTKKSEILKAELESLRELNKIERAYFIENDKIKPDMWDAYSNYCDRVIYPRQRLCESIEKQIRTEENREVAVGDGVTVCMYSDNKACTVIKRTKTTVTVRRDKATLSPDFKPEFIVGGFAGHCTNQSEQTYSYEPDENGREYVLRWSEKFGQFRNDAQGIRLVNGRREFYDYNF